MKWIVISIVLAVVAVASCGPTIRAGAQSSTMRGVNLRLYVKGEGRSHALYTVSPHAVIGFGGGLAAADGETTWQGQLTDAEIESLLRLLKEHGWMDGSPAYQDTEDGDEVDVQFASPETRYGFRTYGGGEHVHAIREYLESIARRRHQDVLDRLPEPGRQR